MVSVIPKLDDYVILKMKNQFAVAITLLKPKLRESVVYVLNERIVAKPVFNLINIMIDESTKNSINFEFEKISTRYRFNVFKPQVWENKDLPFMKSFKYYRFDKKKDVNKKKEPKTVERRDNISFFDEIELSHAVRDANDDNNVLPLVKDEELVTVPIINEHDDCVMSIDNDGLSFYTKDFESVNKLDDDMSIYQNNDLREMPDRVDLDSSFDSALISESNDYDSATSKMSFNPQSIRTIEQSGISLKSFKAEKSSTLVPKVKESLVKLSINNIHKESLTSNGNSQIENPGNVFNPLLDKDNKPKKKPLNGLKTPIKRIWTENEKIAKPKSKFGQQ